MSISTKHFAAYGPIPTAAYRLIGMLSIGPWMSRTENSADSSPNVPETWRFSIDVATSWEQTFFDVPTPHTRKVALRSALTLSPDPGGIFDVLHGLVRAGLGGASGSGKQYISWIHYIDFLRAIDFLLAHQELEGPVNLASPNPLPNRDFMRLLRQAWGVRVGLRPRNGCSNWAPSFFEPKPSWC